MKLGFWSGWGKPISLNVGATGGASDTTAPTCTITCAQSSPTATTPLNFTFTFSETVTGFALGDITVGNGSAGNFAGSGAVYTCDVTPTGMSVVTVDVGAGVCTDTAGNANTAATQFVITSTAPFSDAFTRADGAIGGLWTGATWTIATNAAVNTPATLGTELLTDGDMEAVGVANWTNAGTPVTKEKSTEQVHGGSQSLKIVADSNGDGAYQTPTTSNGVWYRCSAWIYRATGSAGSPRLQEASNGLWPDINTTTLDTWVNEIRSARRSAVMSVSFPINNSGTSYFDDASFKALTLTELFATLPNVSVANVTAQVLVTVTPRGTQAGHIVNLDSTSNPQNFVLAYIDGVKAYLVKCVAGTYTVVIAGTNITYNAASNLKLVKDGDSYSLYYGAPGSETQIGTTQTITSMNGTIHGLFSTWNSAKFDTYQLSNP